jgi:hypothetical protein
MPDSGDPQILRVSQAEPRRSMTAVEDHGLGRRPVLSRLVPGLPERIVSPYNFRNLHHSARTASGPDERCSQPDRRRSV